MAGSVNHRSDVLRKIPYLLVRADEPPVAQECLEQYDDAPDQQHRVCDHFCSTRLAFILEVMGSR